MRLKNRYLKYRFRNEIKNHVFSHTEENICKEKKALILKIEEKDGKEKKKAPFSQVAQITHRHRKVTNAIHERMHHKHRHLFILNFFLANDKRLSSLASLLFTFCLHYTFKHLSKLTKVVCIHAQLENILNLFKPEMHYQKCINIVHY